MTNTHMAATPDAYAIIVAHNRLALTQLLGAARNLPKGLLHQSYSLGLGSFPTAIVTCFRAMIVWSDQINSASPRRTLVLTDAHGNVLASEVRSVHALRTMLDAVVSEFDAAFAAARPHFAHIQEWTFIEGSTCRGTVAEALLHTLTTCAEARWRAATILRCHAIEHVPDIGLIPTLRSSTPCDDLTSPTDTKEVSS